MVKDKTIDVVSLAGTTRVLNRTPRHATVFTDISSLHTLLQSRILDSDRIESDNIYALRLYHCLGEIWMWMHARTDYWLLILFDPGHIGESVCVGLLVLFQPIVRKMYEMD